MTSPSFLIHEQFTFVPLIWRDLSGKTVVVTGSNVGLGFESAKHLASMKPAKLVLAIRDMEGGKKAADEIEAATGLRPEIQKLDLSSFESVKNFAREFQSNSRLDILLSNAAIATQERNVTADGHEATVQVNHLSNMLLIHLLLPILRNTSKEFKTEPRIAVVSSGAHFLTSYPQSKYSDPISALNDPKRSEMSDRYPVSKLLNVFMTRQFAKYFKENGDNISIHCLNPAMCRSSILRNATGLRGLVFWILQALVARTTEQGSRTLVHASVSEDLLLNRGPNGRYWTTNCEFAPSADALNEAYGETVWNESMEILSKHLK